MRVVLINSPKPRSNKSCHQQYISKTVVWILVVSRFGDHHGLIVIGLSVAPTMMAGVCNVELHKQACIHHLHARMMSQHPQQLITASHHYITSSHHHTSRHHHHIIMPSHHHTSRHHIHNRCDSTVFIYDCYRNAECIWSDPRWHWHCCDPQPAPQHHRPCLAEPDA